MNMPIGMIILLMVAALVYFGVAQRFLDRMRLTDRQALLFIAAIIVGSFFDVTIMRTPVQVTVTLGGAVIPALLAIWLIVKADQTEEKVWAVISAVLVTVAVWLGSRYLPYEPEKYVYLS